MPDFLKNLYNKIVNLPLVVDVTKIIAKIGIIPFIIGVIILAIAGHLTFANSFVGKLFDGIGWLSTYAFADSVIFKGYSTIDEIKKGNMAVSLISAALLIGSAYIWQ